MLWFKGMLIGGAPRHGQHAYQRPGEACSSSQRCPRTGWVCLDMYRSLLVSSCCIKFWTFASVMGAFVLPITSDTVHSALLAVDGSLRRAVLVQRRVLVRGALGHRWADFRRGHAPADDVWMGGRVVGWGSFTSTSPFRFARLCRGAHEVPGHLRRVTSARQERLDDTRGM